jgi:hypothetical protein
MNFRQYSQLNWNTSLASVEITNTSDYWSGLGDFYIGEKKNLAFLAIAVDYGTTTTLGH